MADESQPTLVRVHCLTGLIYDLSTPMDFEPFCKCVKADGWLFVDQPGARAWVPFHAIGQFTRLEQQTPLAYMPTGTRQ